MKNIKDFEQFNENNNPNEFDENLIIKNKGYVIDNTILVGYWKYGKNNYYGLPESNWVGWDDKEMYKDFILKYSDLINNNSQVLNYRGYSECRICGVRNGSREYIINNKYVVPGGYLHYIMEHKIKPHKWFLEYVLKHKLNEKIPIQKTQRKYK